jgi:hypothetical protein
MNPTTTTITLDAVDAVELAEICELLAAWLATNPEAATSYDHYIGQAGQAADLRADLHHYTRLLTGTPTSGTTAGGTAGGDNGKGGR